MDFTSFWGTSKYWWIMLIFGVLVAASGVWMMIQPMLAYETIAIVFGWLLLMGGAFQIGLSASVGNKVHGWGWWLAGGMIDLILGFILITNLALTEMSLPYIFAFIFLFKAISNLIASFTLVNVNKWWRLYLLNAALLLILAWIFFYHPVNSMFTIAFMAALIFIYWGVMLALTSFDLRPKKIS